MEKERGGRGAEHTEKRSRYEQGWKKKEGTRGDSFLQYFLFLSILLSDSFLQYFMFLWIRFDNTEAILSELISRISK